MLFARFLYRAHKSFRAAVQSPSYTPLLGLFNEVRQFVTPVVNIFETKDGYALEAEMPGVNKDGLRSRWKAMKSPSWGGARRSR